MSGKKTDDLRNAMKALKVSEPLRLSKNGPGLKPPGSSQNEVARNEAPRFEQPLNESPQNEVAQFEMPRSELPQKEEARFEAPQKEQTRFQKLSDIPDVFDNGPKLQAETKKFYDDLIFARTFGFIFCRWLCGPNFLRPM
jgi:hypothetical protein